MSLPEIPSTLEISLTTRPWAFTSSFLIPNLPYSSLSKDFSIPILPTTVPETFANLG